jgi:TetR/AcrR family transcriptional regulator, transcriptional repressor for nem operon
MRYAPDQKERTRARILRAAARTFRRRGYHASGVDAVMAAAGLTAGGFYAHFRSKDDLFAEVVDHGVREGREILSEGLDPDDPEGLLRGVIEKYLSVEHLRRPADGCVMPPLLGEIARAGARTRRTFSACLAERVGDFASALRGEPAPAFDRATAIWATMVGAMLLARGVADRDEAERILRACRESLLASLDADAAGAGPGNGTAPDRGSARAPAAQGRATSSPRAGGRA